LLAGGGKSIFCLRVQKMFISLHPRKKCRELYPGARNADSLIAEEKAVPPQMAMQLMFN
jgi:hypothetical protein